MITIPIDSDPEIVLSISDAVPMAEQILLVRAAQALADVDPKYIGIVLGHFISIGTSNAFQAVEQGEVEIKALVV